MTLTEDPAARIAGVAMQEDGAAFVVFIGPGG